MTTASMKYTFYLVLAILCLLSACKPEEPRPISGSFDELGLEVCWETLVSEEGLARNFHPILSDDYIMLATYEENGNIHLPGDVQYNVFQKETGEQIGNTPTETSWGSGIGPDSPKSGNILTVSLYGNIYFLDLENQSLFNAAYDFHTTSLSAFEDQYIFGHWLDESAGYVLLAEVGSVDTSRLLLFNNPIGDQFSFNGFRAERSAPNDLIVYGLSSVKTSSGAGVRLTAIDAFAKESIWETMVFPTSHALGPSIDLHIVNDVIVVPKIYDAAGFDKKSGEKIWEWEREVDPTIGCYQWYSIYRAGDYISLHCKDVMTVINGNTGVEVWETSNVNNYTVMGKDGYFYYLDSDGEQLTCRNAATGKLRYNVSLPEEYFGKGTRFNLHPYKNIIYLNNGTSLYCISYQE